MVELLCFVIFGGLSPYINKLLKLELETEGLLASPVRSSQENSSLLKHFTFSITLITSNGASFQGRANRLSTSTEGRPVDEILTTNPRRFVTELVG